MDGTLTPALVFRTFTDTDYPAYAQLVASAHPYAHLAEADLRRTDELVRAGGTFGRLLLEGPGRLSGAAEWMTPLNNARPGRLYVALHLHPANETPDLQAALWSRLLREVRAAGGTELLAHVREDRWALPFLLGRGFVERDRMWKSTLDTRALRDAAFAEHERRAAQAGMRIMPLSSFPLHDEAFLRRLYALTAELLADVPFEEPLEIWPFELWRERVIHGPDLRPEGYFLAEHEGELVGMSQLYNSSDPDALRTGLTGVQRAWRGRGIAWALKLAAARHARDHGFRFVHTSNHSVNAAMLGINEALGFVREAAMVNLRLTLHET